MKSIAFQIRKMPDGQTMRRMVEIRLPSVISVPDPTLTSPNCWGKSSRMRWTVPIDNTHSRTFTVGKFPKGAPPIGPQPIYEGKKWDELDFEGHQRIPGDFEAQVGQGPITFHSEEHLVSSDRGVSMYRRKLREQIARVRAGDDPINLDFEGDGLVKIRADNFIVSGDDSSARTT
jgi:hypothetical protein